MATATINLITFYENGVVKVIVTCDQCGVTNVHDVTDASVKDGDITIDFSKLKWFSCSDCKSAYAWRQRCCS